MADTTPAPVESTTDADLSGRQLGDYRLLRRLGRGGMAEVYLAEQTPLKRQVAFKVLRAGLAADEASVKRFHQEAQAAAALVHANIVQIYEVGQVEGVHYIAQEYVEGVNLREYLLRHGPPDVRLALHVIRQVAAALFRAAERGIVHRDIKPENVMMARTGEVKVADFGLARLLRDEEAVNLTQVGVTMGTPLYMSPEQVEGKPLDHRSDLYSLGVTCYHMLTGAPPFRGDTALAIAVQHLKSPPQRLEELRPDLPPALCRIVHKLLEKDPKARYSSSRDLLRDLRMIQLEDGEDPPPEGDESLYESLELDLAGHFEATGRLDAVMKTSALELYQPAYRKWIPPLAAVLAAVLLGGALSLGMRQPPLLEDVDATQIQIKEWDTAEKQFVYADLQGPQPAWLKEHHWLSVLKFFPDDVVYVRLAKKELALLYYEQQDYDKALTLFNEFANLEPAEQTFRAVGMAGQCLVFARQGKTSQAQARLSQLRAGGLEDKLDSRMKEKMRQVEGLAPGKTKSPPRPKRRDG